MVENFKILIREFFMIAIFCILDLLLVYVFSGKRFNPYDVRSRPSEIRGAKRRLWSLHKAYGVNPFRRI